MVRLLMVMIAFLIVLASPLARADGVGVVFMHGKWGTNKSKSPIMPLVWAMKNAGYKVVAPEMPWSKFRMYDKGIDGAMTEIDKAVAKLIAGGADRIVVGGQSLGANIAMRYGAVREGLAGVLAVAPGHRPEGEKTRALCRESLKKARGMIAAGEGGDRAGFADFNQGRERTVSLKADDYVSYFDPEGPAVMPISAASLKAPLMWVIGKKDRLLPLGKAYAFAKVPDHPNNRYAVVPGGHKVTPKKGIKPILKWLADL